MNLVGILIGLIAAVIVYVVLTAFIAFPHSTLIFALIAIVVFVVCAFGSFGARFRA